MPAEQMDTLHYTNAVDNAELSHIPGDYGLPFIGKAIPMINKLQATIDSHYKQYGEISRLRMGGQHGLLVVGAENYQTILCDKNNNFSSRMGYQQSLASMYPDAILLNDFDDHKKLHTMLKAIFSSQNNADYLQSMNPIIAKHLASIEQHSQFGIYPALQSMLLEISLAVFLGIDIDCEEAKVISQSLISSLEGLQAIVRKEIPGESFALGHESIQQQYAVLRKLLKLRRGTEGKDSLTLLANLKDARGNFYSEEDIVEQIAFLLFSSQETLSSALSCLIMYTGQHPEWQARIRKEAQAINSPCLDYSSLAQCHSTHLTLQEVLRLHPSMPLITRRSIQPCQLGDYAIPAHTIIWLAPTYNHRMEKYWSNPQQFDPERFNAERAEHQQIAFSYLPFGGGAHQCIGMHFANMLCKAFMHQMVLHYDYMVPENYAPLMSYMPAPKPQDDLPLTLKRL